MWLRSLVLAVSAGLLVMEGAIAQPDAIFRPIVSQIKAAAPVGWKIRLPSAIKLTAYDGQVIKLYSKSEGFGDSTFAVSLNSRANCQEMVCGIGSLLSQRGGGIFDSLLSQSVLSKADLSKIRAIQQRQYETWTKSDRTFVEKSRGAVLERSLVDLGAGIKGALIVQNAVGASTPARLILTWKQDRQTYTVSWWHTSLEERQSTPNDRREIINVGKSMVSENPIVGKASMY